jgi:hypothetical protein
MKDYKNIIKYLEKAERLLSGDEVDKIHAKINVQFAIMDLKAIDREQDREIDSMVEQFKQDLIDKGIKELINDKK